MFLCEKSCSYIQVRFFYKYRIKLKRIQMRFEKRNFFNTRRLKTHFHADKKNTSKRIQLNAFKRYFQDAFLSSKTCCKLKPTHLNALEIKKDTFRRSTYAKWCVERKKIAFFSKSFRWNAVLYKFFFRGYYFVVSVIYWRVLSQVYKKRI